MDDSKQTPMETFGGKVLAHMDPRTDAYVVYCDGTVVHFEIKPKKGDQ